VELDDLLLLLGSGQHAGSYAAGETLEGSIRIPGPIVDERVIFFT
jgi:hypothetical protein